MKQSLFHMITEHEKGARSTGKLATDHITIHRSLALAVKIPETFDQFENPRVADAVVHEIGIFAGGDDPLITQDG
jgi:hypothetical protein